MTSPRIAAAGDETVAWAPDQSGVAAYVRALAKADPAATLGNARFDLSVLQLSDRAFAIVAPTKGDCWLTSLAVTYGKTSRDEVARDVSGGEALVFNLLSHLTEGVLRITRADHAIFVNHLLFSTSLYGDWSGGDLEHALDALRAVYPDRAIIWRSLNADEHQALAARMIGLGGHRLLSRIVWRIPDPARDWAPRRDARDDRRLLAAQGLRAETARDLSQEDLRRVLDLYRGLYLDKYSRTNPDYGEALLRAAIESGVLTLHLFRNDAGAIEAVTAEHVYQGTLVNPLLGYDRTLPQARGLYRVAMAASAERAIADGLQINYSAGAGAFKRNRGARPTLEFSMVFDSHLPAWRRISYRGLARALDAMAPMLERIAVR